MTYAKKITKFWKWARNVVLFFAAPFIGLAYLIALPFVGLYLLLNIAVEAALKKAASVIVSVDCVKFD